jgi:carnitine 3-dehydrogenase
MTLVLPKIVGVVGSDDVAVGWAARFLAQGLEVVALVGDEAEAVRLRRGVAEVWPILTKLGLLPGASRDNLRVVIDDVELENLSFVQYGMGEIRNDELGMRKEKALHYSALLIHNATPVMVRAHEPVYLSPLVEVWGEEDAAVAAADFYRQLSIQPIITKGQTAEVSKTSAVFMSQSVVSRLQTAVQQEAEKLRQEGVSAADIDVALQFGLGLDWVIGGVKGRVEAAVHDEALLALMRTLRQYELGAGQVIAAHDARRYTSVARRRWQAADVVEAPLRLYRCDVDASWIDYNGHMTESSYLAAFGDASDALFRYIGIDEAYRASGNSYYTVETHINYYLECGSGDTLGFTTQVLDFDAKRLHFFHTMTNGATGELICTTEQMLVHVDTMAGRAAAAKPHVLEALTAVLAAHQQLPIPKEAGRQMRIKRVIGNP